MKGSISLAKIFYGCVVFIVILSTVSCSQSVSVINQIPEENLFEESDMLPILATSELNGLGSSGYGILGLYEVRIDAENLKGEISGLRKSAKFGDFFVVDITNFLTVTPCTDCLLIEEIKMDEEENVVVTFGLQHPYRIPNPFDPPSLQRKDLHIFDVQGIVFMARSTSDTGIAQFAATRSDTDGLPHTSLKWIKMDPQMRLIDAYGYTSILDEVIEDIYPTDYNVHPFKIFFEYPFEGNFDPNSTLTGFLSVNSARGYNVMAMRPSSADLYNYVDYTFDIGVGQSFNFIMVISASYGQSAKGPGDGLGQRLYPRYFCPQFNRKEAWKVYVAIENNQLLPNSPTSKADVVVYVRDWQESDGTYVASSQFDPMTSKAGSYTTVSGVRKVTVDIPGLTYDKNINPSSLPAPFDPYLFSQTVPETGDGSESNPLKYRVQVQNIMGVGLGTYMGLVAVRDELEGSPLSIGVERDGVAIFPISDFTTYVPFTIDVKLAGSPFDPVQDTIPPSDTTMSNIRFDRNYVAQDGNNIFLIYRGLSGGTDGIWSQRSPDNGVSWGNPQLVSNSMGDIGGMVRAVACNVNGDGNPIAAWVDGASNVIYMMGIKTGSNEINWGMGRYPTSFRNTALSPDLAIESHPTNANIVSIYTNQGMSPYSYLYRSLNARVDYVGDTVTFSQVFNDGYSVIATRPYVDLEIDTNGHNHLVFQIDTGTKKQIIYTVYTENMTEPFFYLVNESVRGVPNYPRIALTLKNEPVVVWEDEGSFSLAGTDIAIAYKADGATAFSKAKRVNNNNNPIANQFKPDIVVNKDTGNAWIIYEDERYGPPQIFMTVIDQQGEKVLIDDFKVNTDGPTYHNHRKPAVTLWSIPGYFPNIHAFWLDYGGPNNPFIGHNNT